MWHTSNSIGLETINLLNGSRSTLGSFTSNPKRTLDFTPDAATLFGGRDTLLIVNESSGATTVVGGHASPAVNMGGYAITDELIVDPTSFDCNESGVPDECELSPDCNENTVPDECDIAGETSEDADTNGIPDECEGESMMGGGGGGESMMFEGGEEEMSSESEGPGEEESPFDEQAAWDAFNLWYFDWAQSPEFAGMSGSERYEVIMAKLKELGLPEKNPWAAQP